MVSKSARENSVESWGCDYVAALGGESIKLSGYEGIPDRLHILPGNKCLFIEYKRPKGGVIAPLQRHWHSMLQGLDFVSGFASSRQEVKDLVAKATTV